MAKVVDMKTWRVQVVMAQQRIIEIESAYGGTGQGHGSAGVDGGVVGAWQGRGTSHL